MVKYNKTNNKLISYNVPKLMVFDINWSFIDTTICCTITCPDTTIVCVLPGIPVIKYMAH